MEILGYIAALFAGLSLGLIGGGGSILMVPILVYLFKLPPVTATSYSLFIVGIASLTGAVSNYQKGNVALRTAILFGVTSITAVFLTRKILLPAIPDIIFKNDAVAITKSMAMMVFFAILMLGASVSMIAGRKKQAGGSDKKKWGPLVLMGAAIGFVTGFSGAGGGFLLIPALIYLVGLDVKTAIGTSLTIIAMNSLLGFTGDIGNIDIRWSFLLSISGLAIAGIIIGGIISKFFDGSQLKKMFGWFVLAMGAFILIQQLFLPG